MTFYRIWDFACWCLYFMLLGTAIVVVVRHPDPWMRVVAVLWASAASYRQGRWVWQFRAFIDGLVTRV
jgi:hypothetical protein